MPRKNLEIRRVELGKVKDQTVFGVCIVGKYGNTVDEWGNYKNTRLLTKIFVSNGDEKINVDHMWVWKVDSRLWKVPEGYIIKFTATVNTYGKYNTSYCLENLRILSMTKP